MFALNDLQPDTMFVGYNDTHMVKLMEWSWFDVFSFVYIIITMAATGHRSTGCIKQIIRLNRGEHDNEGCQPQ